MENKRIIQIRGAKEHNLKGIDLDFRANDLWY